MKTSHSTASPARLAVAVLLSQLLERLDRSAEPVGAEQYLSVVRHLKEEFDELGCEEVRCRRCSMPIRRRPSCTRT